MKILDYSKYCLFLSVVLVVASIFAIAVFGLKPGIEFTGGSILGVEYAKERPSLEFVRGRLAGMDVGLVSAQEAGEQGIILRMRDLSEKQHQAVLTVLGSDAREVRFESIGPVIGKELRGKSLILLMLVLGAITLYVMFAFRKMRQPVHPFRWSLAALVALLHDILIPLGALAVLGAMYGEQITIPVVVALLTVAGYSVNDTVVIFDRIRENFLKKTGTDFADTVRKGLEQTLVRSVNTSLTTLLVVLAIVFFGGETLRLFALTLAIGMGAGVWSSLFVAPFVLTRKGKFGLI
ncbi:MAG TPA: protein translocase subunit SecF [Candidatus Wildermuthbacteria bacterium]|uniref:Protein-export membrane protein SecF n=2 Tax=Parcubacteria group TaxID=1794811 RepID=A0A837INT0_9BACT|nr:MAG: Protein translocase subunit SecF [Candidatus Yanofskybacteria bacterium GW2011_GWC1_48_11]KKW04137.1 MAG: Protein translocase subunit SecF [Parcubacteria group bacterium GW2011_GWB1_49_12]KKW08412.1 MAG: Protein translocase subunit SecF [Parcubacteria group bacterium GW2011_GWA1_49_26]KKW14341.1 MAG: Protein translocase subunit SecF [Parcubacteria group bacterium GW2011_GWA2_50_10]OHA61185.1 MAG: protein-export membrane protein SecF [Candidatus Wildermuthbacteria bacterium GWA1_49_26]O